MAGETSNDLPRFVTQEDIDRLDDRVSNRGDVEGSECRLHGFDVRGARVRFDAQLHIQNIHRPVPMT